MGIRGMVRLGDGREPAPHGEGLLTGHQGLVQEPFGCELAFHAPAVRPRKRWAFFKGGAQKRGQNVITGASGAFGIAAARLMLADK